MKTLCSVAVAPVTRCAAAVHDGDDEDAIAKCSPDTALRDIGELIALGVLRKMAGGGRSTAYELTD